jgi:hypothetical protein
VEEGEQALSTEEGEQALPTEEGEQALPVTTEKGEQALATLGVVNNSKKLTYLLRSIQ